MELSQGRAGSQGQVRKRANSRTLVPDAAHTAGVKPLMRTTIKRFLASTEWWVGSRKQAGEMLSEEFQFQMHK